MEMAGCVCVCVWSFLMEMLGRHRIQERHEGINTIVIKWVIYNGFVVFTKAWSSPKRFLRWFAPTCGKYAMCVCRS